MVVKFCIQFPEWVSFRPKKILHEKQTTDLKGETQRQLLARRLREILAVAAEFVPAFPWI